MKLRLRASLVAIALTSCGGGTAIVVVEPDGGAAPADDAGVADASSDVDAAHDAAVKRCDISPDAGAALDLLALDVGTAPPLRDPRRALSLTADERVIVFSRANGTGPARLHYATRPSAKEPFGAPVPLPLADPGDESFAPSLSGDGGELVWTRGVAGQYEMRISRRLADGTYDAGEAVTVAGVKPEATATRALVPNALYFLEYQGTSEIDGWWLRRAQRDKGGAFAIPTLDFEGAWRAGLAVTSDELGLYLTRGSPAEGPWHGGPTEMAHRSSVDLPWGAFLLWPAYTEAGPVVTGADGLQPESSFDARWVSPDECRVYIYVIDPNGAPRVGVLKRYD